MGVWKKGHTRNRHRHQSSKLKPSVGSTSDAVPRPIRFFSKMSFQNLHNQKILRHMRLETPLIHARLLFYSKTPNIRVGGINRANGTSRTCRKKGTNRGSRTTRSSRSSRTSWPTSTTWSSWKEIRTSVQKLRVILRKGIMKSFRLKQKKDVQIKIMKENLSMRATPHKAAMKGKRCIPRTKIPLKKSSYGWVLLNLASRELTRLIKKQLFALISDSASVEAKIGCCANQRFPDKVASK